MPPPRPPRLPTDMKKYRNLDERVLSHILAGCEPNQEFVSRTQARYGLMSVSSPEFDDIMNRYEITTEYNPRTHGQRYRVAQIAKALEGLLMTFQQLEEGSGPFTMGEE
jgi:hypothetical protein